jgi:uncharacterized membrane protein YbhN (UPF0104 family)
MKDIIIPARRIKTEFLILLICIAVANLVNVYAIWHYETSWLELITWQRFVLFIGFIFYILTVVARLIALLVGKLSLKHPAQQKAGSNA